MSKWTQLKGIIQVYGIGETQAQIRYVLETVLDHLPKVTGSESDMHVHLVPMHGYSASSSHNEFGELMLLVDPKKRQLETQPYYLLVLEGEFRDRVFEETFKEFNRFINRLSKRVIVEDILVRISDREKVYMFDNPKPYNAMFEDGSFLNHEEPAWWEYLLPENAPGYLYPMTLLKKYYNDPDNNAEWERRWSYKQTKYKELGMI